MYTYTYRRLGNAELNLKYLVRDEHTHTRRGIKIALTRASLAGFGPSLFLSPRARVRRFTCKISINLDYSCVVRPSSLPFPPLPPPLSTESSLGRLQTTSSTPQISCSFWGTFQKRCHLSFGQAIGPVFLCLAGRFSRCRAPIPKKTNNKEQQESNRSQSACTL